MKTPILLTAAAFLIACDGRVNTSITDKAVEPNPTVANTPARKKKQLEDMTIIIYPPGSSNTAGIKPLPLPQPRAINVMDVTMRK
ncbi:MAG: hypothetical protein ACKVY0_05940 [Prosthecobacter sp.]|uniref:hypothetical protein n=1 Tax=Prosthecobacter sp. TaxID=1965333 RepID=UPI003904481E